MPEIMESWDDSRLVPAKPKPPAFTEAFVFKPAASGQVVTYVAGARIAVDPTTKKAVPYASGASDGTQIIVGLSEWPITVNDKGKCYLGIYTAAQIPDSRIPVTNTSPVFISGVFDARDCETMDDAAIAAWGATKRQDGFIQKAS